MSDEKLLPLSSAASSLIDAERARPDEDADRAERIFERLATSVALGAAGAAAGASAVQGASGSADAATFWTKKTVVLAVSAFVLGGGAGAALHAGVSPTVQGPAPVASTIGTGSFMVVPTPSAVPTTSIDATRAVAPAVAAANAASAPSAGARVQPAASGGGNAEGERDVDLAHERAMIDRARMASARHAPAEVLTALEEHARLYPAGRLAEEREALAIGALADMSRDAEAKERATRFRKRYRTSVFLPAIDAIVSGDKKDAVP